MSEATAPVRDSTRADLIGPRVILSLTSPAAVTDLGDRQSKIQGHAAVINAGKPSALGSGDPSRRLAALRLASFQQIVDIGACVEKLICKHQRCHDEEPVVPDRPVLAGE